LSIADIHVNFYFVSLNQYMRKLFIFIFSILLFSGCKKKIEQIQQDLVVQAMTNGQWAVTSFTQNGTDITADFSSYKFQYYSNKTVDAIQNGSVQITGTWDGNANTMTTSANFTNPAYPITLINGSWHITDNSWTYVKATQTNGTGIKTMRLDKL
jgi:hypothetical protein